DALTIYTREQMPLQWATTQDNLGNALSSLGESKGETAKLEEAIVVYREALEERTRDRVPLSWATTNSNLAITLSKLGEREVGTARIEEAIAIFRDAIAVVSTLDAPHQMEMLRRNLARAEELLSTRR